MDGFEVPGEKKITPTVLPFRSPSPSENLAVHPYFRAEYALPDDPSIDALISRRRMRATASVSSSSPAPAPAHEKPATSGRGSRRKRNQTQLKNMAGLVAGDSDSSALTQESGDESAAPTPTTNPDAGTEYAEGDNEREPSPGMSLGLSSQLCSCFPRVAYRIYGSLKAEGCERTSQQYRYPREAKHVTRREEEETLRFHVYHFDAF